MNKSLLFSLLLTLPFGLSPLQAAEHTAEPVVLTTIAPLTWLVRALAPAGTDVQTLLPTGKTPHDYPLKPADVVRIQNSALTVWVGPGMEPWLAQIAERLPAAQQLALLPHSAHLHEEEHQHDNKKHQHDDEEEHHTDALHDATTDPHLWLEPLAMAQQAEIVATRLQQLYPAQQETIQKNLIRFQQSAREVDTEISAMLAPVSTRGFVVYHDGYQRIVQRHHLNQRAAVWQHESIPAGARERAALLKLLNSGEVVCLFYEPEHGRDAVSGWLGNATTKVKMVELDPLGQNIAVGPDQYVRFMRGLAAQMVECLR
jgi:zinc transport system substrate-binding protein